VLIGRIPGRYGRPDTAGVDRNEWQFILVISYNQIAPVSKAKKARFQSGLHEYRLFVTNGFS
jgi:hypothetical protein